MNTYLHQLSIPYHDYLGGYEWDLVATLTTPYTMSLASAERAMQRFENNIKEEFPENRIFWAAEKFSGEGYHIHLLAAFKNSTKNFTKKNNIVNSCWKKAVAGSRRPNTHIRKFNRNKNGINYSLKDIHKRNIGYGFLGNSW
jgi:hypothetical protein